jgi:hypothetical protein
LEDGDSDGDIHLDGGTDRYGNGKLHELAGFALVKSEE